MILNLFLFIFSNQLVNCHDTPQIISDEVNFRRVCYYANWAPYRKIDPILYPDNIDPNICTHIHYAFAKINPDTLELLSTEEHDMNWTEKSHIPLYIRLYGLKRRNPQLKTLLAVGGWSAKSVGFNEATRNYTKRLKFINQTIKILREWNFDGIDLGKHINKQKNSWNF
jgi:chitinase